jgi:RimJ/RimL family protein N-acetyltransferase
MAQSPYEGKLIRLRAREPEDEPLLYQWFNDPEVTEFLSMRYPLSHAQEKDFVERTKAIAYGGASFAVETAAEQRLIGGCELRTAPPEDRWAELGIALGDKASWDGGYGTDVMVTLCRFGFQEMNLHRIELWVHARNSRARHVYEKVGFREEGVRRQAFFKHGQYRDVVLMGLLEDEFRALTTTA